MAAEDFLPRITTALTPVPTPRSAVDKLPSYLQSDLLKKFFGVTLDQWLQPAQQENVSGFIGERNGLYYQPESDYYLEEPTASRNDYQLEPTIVSVDNNNNTNFVEFYQDLINSLEFDGALVNNHSRLFSEEYYSWCPPINPDMFINFTNYFWVSAGPQTIYISDSTDAVVDIIGKKYYTTPTSNITLQSGMKIQFTNDANVDFNNIPFIVENVGTSIQLIDDSAYSQSDGYDVPDYDTTPYDDFNITGNPNYWTIKRGSQDGNPWSRTNRWFHKDVLGEIENTGVSFTQAHRPIIEFLPNLQLRNFARYSRPDVTAWSTNQNVSDLVGQTQITIDSAELSDGDTVLVTGDIDPSRNNRIYKVFGLKKYGVVGLELLADGLDPTGSPVLGEGVKIIKGATYSLYQVYFNGTTFVSGQQKMVDNQPPIYNLYDLNGNLLDNAVEYPNSNFNGSQIFNYSPVNGGAIDPYLSIPLSFTDFGSLSFDNLLTTQRFNYTSNNTTVEIPGYYFYRMYQGPKDIGADLYLNDWHKGEQPSKQYVLDRFVIESTITSENIVEFPRNFTLSITPTDYHVYLNGQTLISGTDYTITGNELNLSLSLSLANNDVLEIESWAPVINQVNGNGYFEIPENLNANPDNQQIGTKTFNQINQQLLSIIANQQGLIGAPYGPNNYNSTPRDLTLGNSILNHSASLLRVGLLTGKSQLKLTDSVRYNNREYNSFKGKFLLKIQQFIQQGYTNLIPASVWVQDALNAINIGKTPSFPFAYSAMTANNNYIPSTASALGVTPVYAPSMYLDDTRLNPVMVIQGHDGSLYDTYGDFRDQVILELENEIYNNIDPYYNTPQPIKQFDLLTLKPGYFRTTEYSRDEWLKISQPGFERWVVKQRIDYTTNSGYDETNPFTWNYSNQKAANGTYVPGSWRGIYEYFFDTFRPHSHPWEMLGLSQKPTWWSTLYGPAPYTRDNLVMWTDIQNGTIRQGATAGTYQYLARPGLLNIIPVDSAGNLLDPVSAGIVSTPDIIDAQANWRFGDIGPGEYMWKISSSYPYDLAEAMFLAKPANFVDLFWEARKLSRDQGQLYDIDLGRRFTSEDLHVHNEILSDGSRAVVKGFSNWVSDYLASLNIDIAPNFGELARDLGVKLAYKTGAYIKNQNLRVVSETFGIVPNENITVQLYKSASISQPVYSAVIVMWDGSSYRVSGYDSINDNFTIIPGAETGTKTGITVGDVTISRYDQGINTTQNILYNSKLPSREAVYNFLIAYQRWLETQGWVFNDYDFVNNQPVNFDTAARQFLLWSQVPLNAGDSIILSPISDHIVFSVPHGFVDNIQTYVNGVYGVLDRTGFGIASSQFQITRSSETFEVTINPDSVQGIYCLRLSVVEYEHVMLLDNTTNFNDLVYDPILGVRQPRFEVFINRTKYWDGTPTTYGFIIQDNGLIDNFEYSVDNFRRFFDFDWQPATGIQGELAQHVIGFQERSWMADLLLNSQIEFDFYKKFISLKGTEESFNNILRSTYITKTAGFDLLEEWAVLIGEYGNTERKSSLEIQVIQSQFLTNPQLIEFVNTSVGDPTIIDITPSDARWVLKNKKNNTNNQFVYRNFVNNYRQDLPNAGYVRVDEVTYSILNENNFQDLFNTVVETNSSEFNEGDTVWTTIRSNGGWSVYRVCEDQQLTSISLGANVGDPTVLTTVNPHNLVAGDIIFFQSTTSTSPDLIGVQTVLDVPSANQFRISTNISTGITYPTIALGTTGSPAFSIGDTIVLNGNSVSLTGTTLSQTISDINDDSTLSGLGFVASNNNEFLQIKNTNGTSFTISGTGATDAGLPANSSYSGLNVYAFKPVRFANETARDNFTPALGWKTGDLVWIDNNSLNPPEPLGTGLWEITRWNGTSWDIVRTQTDKIDIDQIYNSFVYDNITNTDVIQLELYDPYKGLIFSAAEAEISYQLDYDPAKYNNGDPALYHISPDQAWGPNEKGRLWWDLSTVRFLDYEQGDIAYSRKYWGQLAPNTTVNIYEWVESPVPPSSWDSYVLSQANAGSNRPTGTVPLEENTPYVQRNVFNPATNGLTTLYYFWVLAPNTIPDGLAFRKLDASAVTQLISNPKDQSIAWIAPVSTNAFIVNNLDNYINDQSSVLQITFFAKADDSIIHKQWLLIRENDEINAPYQPIWNKMRDSLVGYDDLNLSVPDTSLSSVEIYGNSFRPRQTWFADRLEARLEFFEKVNSILSPLNITNIVGYDSNLNKTDPQPAITAYDYSVATRADRDLLNNTIAVGKKVLVQNDEFLNNFWSLWQYAGGSSWTLLSKQLYDSSTYWYTADWYSSGYSSSTQWQFEFASIPDMNANISNFADGNIIKVDNDGAGNWVLYLFNSSADPQLQLIAQQNGTIQFRLSIAQYDSSNSYLDSQASAVTKIFLYALQTDILTILQQNQLIVTMIRYAHSEQTIVPWVFKSSLVYGLGLIIPLEQDFIQNQNLTDDLINYLDEAKPYHTKLRSVTEQRRTQLDIADIHATDIHDLDIGLIYDRVTQFTNIPEGADPRNYDISKLNAADRIQLFYAPTEGMPPKILEKLIKRSEFGGTILDGKTFYQFATLYGAGYDNSDYDLNLPQSGYDFDCAHIIGSVVNPTVTIGDVLSFTIGDNVPASTYNVIFNGTTLQDVVNDINAMWQLRDLGIVASIVETAGSSIGFQLQINDTNNYDFELSSPGTALSDLGLPSIVNASSLIASNIENFYDVFINGGDPLDNTPSFNAPQETDSSIDVDGNKFVQPYLDEDHPEELTKIRSGDTLVLDVYTYNEPLDLIGYDAQNYDFSSNPYTVLGTAVNPIVNVGDELIINSIPIIMTGQTLDDIVNDINGNSEIVALRISADNNSGQLEISQAGPNISMTFDGVVATTCGLPASVSDTILIEGGYDDAGSAIPPDLTKTLGLRIFKNIFGNFDYLRISDTNTTYLTDVLLSSEIDHVTVNDATILGQPDIAAQRPGVIFINGERITFWSVDTSTPGQHKLLQIMRGTRGTGINPDITDTSIRIDAGVIQAAAGLPLTSNAVAVGTVSNPSFDLVALGSVVNPTFSIGDTLVINGNTVTLTGTNLSQTILDINNAAIPGIVATNNGNQLQITNTTTATLSFSGNAQVEAGLNNSYNNSIVINGYTIVLTAVSLAGVINNINQSGLSNISASQNISNQLVISLTNLKVRDGSADQMIPGGWNWEFTPSGLENSKTTQALFLQESSGNP